LLDVEDAQLVSQIVTTSSRINGFVSDLIEAVGIPLGEDGLDAPAPTDIRISDQKSAKIKTIHPNKGLR
jgi:hypothetical protein